MEAQYLIWALRRGAETGDLGRVGGSAIVDLPGCSIHQAALSEVNYKSLVDEKIRTKDRAFDVGDPKLCRMECPGQKYRRRSRFPYVAISVPLAATREGVRGSAVSWGEAGKTHASAPESTSRNCRLVRSQIVIVFVD